MYARRMRRLHVPSAVTRIVASTAMVLAVANGTMEEVIYRGVMLAWLTRTVDTWGNIASIGLAGGAELHTTVMPFILRGINLIGINSAAQLRDTRLVVWGRIAGDLRPRHLAKIAGHCIDLDALPGAFDAYLKGTVTGRTVVRIGVRAASAMNSAPSCRVRFATERIDRSCQRSR